jgi:hypothetical protein
MTAFAALTLPNNAAVDQTFNPVGIDPQGVAKWLGTETILDGKKSVTMSVALPKNGSTVVRIKQRVTIPVMDAVDTTKKIAEAYADVVIVLPKQATATNRLDLRRFTEKLLENAVTTAAVSDFESIY